MNYRPVHAVAFATVSGIVGLSILYHEVNGMTAMLGAVNLILYTLIYTPMKRISIANTWIGSVGECILSSTFIKHINIINYFFLKTLLLTKVIFLTSPSTT